MKIKFKKPIPLATAWVNITTAIHKACAKEFSRYALSRVMIKKSRDGMVFGAATDGHVAAVVEYEGEASQPTEIPREVLPQKNGIVSLDRGVWKNPDTSKYHDHEERVPGQVPPPPIDDVLPKAGSVIVTINAKQLYALSQALGNDVVNLFIKPEHVDAYGCCSKAIAVLGGDSGDAIGVVMPVSNHRDNLAASYKAVKDRFVKAWR